jgi:flagellar P-ring protein precursor FlgI
MRTLRPTILAAVLLVTAQSALAVKIADITRMNGARTNVLTGIGLVVGLKGTGDGGSYLPAMKPLAALLTKFADPTSVADLSNASNVAIVMVTVTLPRNGVRNGDALDVHVFSNGAATSLKNGHLFNAALMGPNGKPYIPRDAQGNALPPMAFALANGDVQLEDPTAPTNGIVKGGAVMEVDLPAKYIDDSGRFTLIIDDPSASWGLASRIAKLINESGSDAETIAVAVDPKNVVVQIPAVERDRPDSFIAGILSLPVPILPTEARVTINDKTGTMIITGDVEISPVVISQKGLTITTVTPAPVPTQRNPLIGSKSNIPLDTTNQGGARLQDLANAFDQLKVPIEDRIEIIKQLYETGKLHAKLIVDGQEK